MAFREVQVHEIRPVARRRVDRRPQAASIDSITPSDRRVRENARQPPICTPWRLSMPASGAPHCQGFRPGSLSHHLLSPAERAAPGAAGGERRALMFGRSLSAKLS